MAEKSKLHLQVITPSGVKIDDMVDMVIFRCTTGAMGILPGHEARSAALGFGVMRILGGVAENERWLAVFGGMASISGDKLTVMTGEAEWPKDVDAVHAQTEREHYEQQLQEHVDDLEILRDQALLWRALVRLELSAYPHVEGSGTDA